MNLLDQMENLLKEDKIENTLLIELTLMKLILIPKATIDYLMEELTPEKYDSLHEIYESKLKRYNKIKKGE